MCDKRFTLQVLSVAFVIISSVSARRLASIVSENNLTVLTVGPKIINGTVAEQEQTKHQVSIRLKKLDWFFGAGHICGGSLIQSSIVVTAAHCVFNYQLQTMRTADEFVIAMGSIDRYDRIKSQAFEVEEIIYKETFNSTTFRDDIALIFLNGSVNEEDTDIQAIRVNFDIVPDGTVCQVTGWGLTEDGFISDLLMSLPVPIINHQECANNYEGFVQNGMICAGYMEGMKDACDGDSGGPLVCNGKLTGIVSFGSGCGQPNYPGVYTEVRHHSEWIRRYVGGVVKLKIPSILLIIVISLTVVLF